MKADGRRMTAEDYCELGDFILVSQDEWTGFVNSGIYRAWIKNNAPPTEGQVVRYWTDAPKAKPDGPTAEARSRGGSRSNHNQWLQEAIEHIIRELDGDGTPVTFPNVWGWVERNALPGENYEFIPPILGCDSPYVEGDKLYFKDQTGANNSMAKSSLKRYFTRAMKTRTQNN
jgi:anaerobic ribonucleoside-triphosphate reductase